MAPLGTCECGWLCKDPNSRSSTRASVAHLKKCTLRAGKATSATTNYSKRRIMDTEMGGADQEDSMEPPHKAPRLLVSLGDP